MAQNVYRYPTIFSFETTINYYDLRKWLKSHPFTPFLITVIYLLMVFGIKKLMTDRKPFKLKSLLIFWNVSLSIFSIIGSIRVIPNIFHTINVHGFHYSLCTEGDVSGVYGFWTSLFILSKIPELGDTLFVVLRKQKLIFLHWFHHLTVLIMVWFCNQDVFSVGRYFMVMNYIVHSIMYTYYALKSIGFKLPRSLAMVITSLQLAQMFTGLYITSYVYVEKFEGRSCEMAQLGLYISLIMYASYMLLFLNFFVHSYLGAAAEKVAISTVEPIIRGMFGKRIQPSAIILSRAHSESDRELPLPSSYSRASSSEDDLINNNNNLRCRRVI